MRVLVLFIIWFCLCMFSGCNQHKENDEAPEPSVTLSKVPNSTFNYVTLSQTALDRIGIELVPVKEYRTQANIALPNTQQTTATPITQQPTSLSSMQQSAKQVPYSAIIYGINGETWVYILVKSLTFVRAPVVIDHVTNDLAILSSGPPLNTLVVSIGATELYGSEYIGNIEP